jgi:hypothetical protein
MGTILHQAETKHLLEHILLRQNTKLAEEKMRDRNRQGRFELAGDLQLQSIDDNKRHRQRNSSKRDGWPVIHMRRWLTFHILFCASKNIGH